MSWSHFASPVWLAFALVVLVVAVGYAVTQRRQRKRMLRFANLDLLEKVTTRKPNRFRHLPIALGLAGLLLLTVALAGPTAMYKVPRNRATVILVIDASLSMKATDVQPSRLAAAQTAAKKFVDSIPTGINLGLVAFSDAASVLVSPRTNRLEVRSAIDNMQLSAKSATGEGIFTALQAIQTLNSVLGGGNAPAARIVMESDGRQTSPAGLDDPRGAYTAAREAKAKGVPVSTISFGTDAGTAEVPDDSGNTQSVPVPVDDESLKKIANLSGGAFFKATNLADLHKAYDTLEQQIGYEKQRGDAGRPWTILATLVLTAAFAAALLIRRRLP
ncbi:MAG: VWA domain-containing protein [Mycobacteriaceae bacterium]|nr:VWA domain-containing protein [Mycobacteriaceae bacterium]